MSLIKGLFVGLVFVTGGCVSDGTTSGPIPEGGPKMIDIYRGATVSESPSSSAAGEDPDCDTGSSDSYGRCLSEYDSGATDSDFVLGESDGDRDHPLYEDYTRTSTNEVHVLFPRLPNPDIAIYVYPHLATRNEVPIPGYATVIPLYSKVEYALPGESLGRAQ